jgi:transcriptional regulator with XRE-family HTH domain
MVAINSRGLKEIRTSRMLTITELARASDVSVKALRRLEAGRPYRLETARRLLAGLGLTIEEARQRGLLVTTE